MNKYIIAVKLALGALVSWWSGIPYTITQVTTNKPSQELIVQLKQFESSFSYPFSATEQFTIEHGHNGDYFAFFKRLGEPSYFIATNTQDKNTIAAACCCILRKVPTRIGTDLPAWYLCDLKVAPEYQGQHLPVYIAQKIGLWRFLQCPRGYGICMNPVYGEPKAARIFKKHGPIKGLQTQTLNLYTLTAAQVRQYLPALKASLVKHGYMQQEQYLSCVSTTGAKDYIIFDTNTKSSRSWELLHLRPSTQYLLPQEHATHMICAVDNTTLDGDFKKLLGKPSSTAQIVSYGMDDIDFNFITSDQI
jgi:hypothetical protein